MTTRVLLLSRGVRLDNRKVLCAPGPRTKYFEFFLFVKLILLLNIRLLNKKNVQKF